MKLYLIRGVPGSGKSTFANDLKSAGIVSAVIEADDYFTDNCGNYNFDASRLFLAHKQCQEITKSMLAYGKNVAVSNTSTTEKEVETYQKIADEYGATFVSIIVENRHSGKNEHNVPEEKIQQMRQRFSIKL